MLGLPARIHDMLAGGVPWWQILYTGLMSTDAVLMIEVLQAHPCCQPPTTPTSRSCMQGRILLQPSSQVVALHDVSSTDAAIIYSMEPVLGAGLAYALLGERWGRLGWVGAALIIASSLAAQILGTEEADSPSKDAAAAPVPVPARPGVPMRGKVLQSGREKKRQ